MGRWILPGIFVLFYTLTGCGDRVLVPADPEVYDPSKPDAITLFSPANDYTSTNRRPEFSWQSFSSYGFRLLVSTNSNFQQLLYNESFPAGTTASWTPPADITTDHIVYWQVIGTNSTQSNASPVNVIRPPLAMRSVVISEILWGGVRKDTGYYSMWKGSFIEFCNAQTFAINVGGFSLVAVTSNGRFTNTYLIPPGTRLAPGGFFVMGQDCSMHSTDYFLAAFKYDDFSFTRPNAVAEDSFFGLIQQPDPTFLMVLYDQYGRLIDRVNAAPALGGFAAPGSSATPKRSMERNQPFADGDLLGSWTTATGSANVTTDYDQNTLATPGAANSTW